MRYVLGALAAVSLCAGPPAEAGDAVCCSDKAYVYHHRYNARRHAYRNPPYWVPPVHFHVYHTGPSPAYEDQRLRYWHNLFR
jgi:hypothetical protein